MTGVKHPKAKFHGVAHPPLEKKFRVRPCMGGGLAGELEHEWEGGAARPTKQSWPD